MRAGSRLVEEALIREALAKTDGNVTRSARALGISRRSLQSKMKELGLRESPEDAAAAATQAATSPPPDRRRSEARASEDGAARGRSRRRRAASGRRGFSATRLSPPELPVILARAGPLGARASPGMLTLPAVRW